MANISKDIKELFYQIKVLGTEIPTAEFSKMLEK